MENIAQRVRSIFSDCFFTEEEVEAARKNGQAVPEGAVLAEGIQGKIGFHPVRLAGHKAEITAILDEMDPSFHKSSGGGDVVPQSLLRQGWCAVDRRAPYLRSTLLLGDRGRPGGILPTARVLGRSSGQYALPCVRYEAGGHQ